jgi:hypothetical protein
VPLWKLLMLWIQYVISFTSTIFIFHLKNNSCLQTLRRFYGVTSLWRDPFIEIIIFENQDDFCFLWEFGLWIFTTQPFHSHTLAYCRPIHQISIEFQNIDNICGFCFRGATLWHLWTMRNLVIFQEKQWSHDLVTSLIWQNLLDYGRSTWT